jgi:hypothetical protein
LVARGGVGLLFGPAVALERIERLGDLFAPALNGGQSLAGVEVGARSERRAEPGGL